MFQDHRSCSKSNNIIILDYALFILYTLIHAAFDLALVLKRRTIATMESQKVDWVHLL